MAAASIPFVGSADESSPYALPKDLPIVEAIEQIATAKQVCAECDARVECLEYAISTNQDSGIWGGTSEEERRQMRRARQARQRRTA